MYPCAYQLISINFMRKRFNIQSWQEPGYIIWQYYNQIAKMWLLSAIVLTLASSSGSGVTFISLMKFHNVSIPKLQNKVLYINNRIFTSHIILYSWKFSQEEKIHQFHKHALNGEFFLLYCVNMV